MGLIRRTPAHLVWIPGQVAGSVSGILPSDCLEDPSDGSFLFVGDQSRVDGLCAILGETPHGTATVPGRPSGRDWARAVMEARLEGLALLRQTTDPEGDDRIVDRFLADPSTDFVFQPIVSLATGTPRAFEALARPHIGPIAHLAAAAARSRRGIDVDLALLDSALARIGELPDRIQAHVNLLPSTLLDRRFAVATLAARCRSFGIEPFRIAVECTEYQVVPDLDRLARCVAELRLAGFGVAVDDAGAGHASFVLIARVHPTTIKIDRGIVKGCDQDSAKQGLVQAFVMFARRIGAALVAEGVETAEELEELRGLGVDLIQGYLVGRPQPEPDIALRLDALPELRAGHATFAASAEGAARAVASAQAGMGSGVANTAVLPTVASIAAPAPVVRDQITGLEARQRFLDDPSLTTLVFADPLDRPKAALTRERLFGSLSSQYGYALFAERPAMGLADVSPATVRADESIVNVAVSSTARSYASLYDDLLVVDSNGALVGLVRFRDLLRALANADREEARDRNPLTGLPGNRRIEQALAGLLEQDFPITVSYIDLNHFKRFNDLAGFIAGDRAIYHLGRAIVDVTSRRGARFVGHIGGDDFIVVWSDRRDARASATEIHREVAEAIGSIEGLPEGVAPPGITIATLNLEAGQIRDVITLAQNLATLKGAAKARGCSVYAVASLANLASPRCYPLEGDGTIAPFERRLVARQGSLLA